MRWREKLNLFVLTKEEQRTIAFIVLALFLGLLTKHYRAQHDAKPPAQESRDAVLSSPH